jgi:DNA-binding XRE family transcriptional regulator
MHRCISYGQKEVRVYAPTHYYIDSVYAPTHNDNMLEQIRKQQGLTQEQLAEKSGVDQTTISRLERGDIKRPRWEVVANLAQALKVKPEKLFPTNAA